MSWLPVLGAQLAQRALGLLLHYHESYDICGADKAGLQSIEKIKTEHQP